MLRHVTRKQKKRPTQRPLSVAAELITLTTIALAVTGSEDTEVSSDESGRTLWAEGHYWRVHAIPAPSFDRRRGSHLLFACSEIGRRVRVFPEDWMQLSDAELYELCDRRRAPRD